MIYPSRRQAVLEVGLDSPGVVILADVDYPGWELAIDGTPAPIYRVNGVMRGAAVSSGSHRLVYTYAPQSFRIGADRINRRPRRALRPRLGVCAMASRPRARGPNIGGIGRKNVTRATAAGRIVI